MNYQLIWFTNSVNGQDYEIKNFRKFSGLERFLRTEPYTVDQIENIKNTLTEPGIYYKIVVHSDLFGIVYSLK